MRITVAIAPAQVVLVLAVARRQLLHGALQIADRTAFELDRRHARRRSGREHHENPIHDTAAADEFVHGVRYIDDVHVNGTVELQSGVENRHAGPLFLCAQPETRRRGCTRTRGSAASACGRRRRRSR